jgi:hypothetical protein
MSRIVVFAGFLLLLGGCGGSLRNATSGQIGCPPDQTVVFNRHTGWSSGTWSAACQDDFYTCSSVSTGQNSSQVNCSAVPPERVTPEMREQAATAASQGG